MPDEEADHKRGHKHPFVANELISCECWPVLNNFFTSPSLLDRVFKYLDSSRPAPILDGYFSKLVSILVIKNPAYIFNYLESNNLLPSLVSLIRSKSISDLILKMILLEQVDVSNRKLILAHLLEILNSSEEVKVLYATGIVVDTINKCNEVAGLKELVAALGTGEWLGKLIELSNSGSGFNATAGLEVLRSLIQSEIVVELLRSGKAEDGIINYDEDECELVKALVSVVPGLVRRLERETQNLPGTHRKDLELVGIDRLKIVEFLHAAAKLDLKEILTTLQKNQVFQVLTRMFFKFELNSMLHNRYENFFTFIFDKFANEEEILINLINSSDFLKLLDLKSNSIGLGGHILKLGTTLNRIKNRNSEFSNFLDSSDEWKKFYQEVYKKKIEVEKKTLGETSSKVSDDLSSDDSGHEKLNEPKDTIEILFEKSGKQPKDSSIEIKEKDEGNNSESLSMQDLEPLNIKDLDSEGQNKKNETKGRDRYNDSEEPDQVLEVSDSDYWRY